MFDKEVKVGDTILLQGDNGVVEAKILKCSANYKAVLVRFVAKGFFARPQTDIWKETCYILDLVKD
jgi:hypothetical protein